MCSVRGTGTLYLQPPLKHNTSWHLKIIKTLMFSATTTKTWHHSVPIILIILHFRAKDTKAHLGWVSHLKLNFHCQPLVRKLAIHLWYPHNPEKLKIAQLYRWKNEARRYIFINVTFANVIRSNILGFCWSGSNELPRFVRRMFESAK